MALTLTWQSYQGNTPPFSQSEELDSNSSIGRAPTNQFVVHDPEKYVSRCHAEIYEVGGNWFIKDQSSTNTVINNSVSLVQGQQFLLSVGDEITIGESVFVVENITTPHVEMDEEVESNTEVHIPETKKSATLYQHAASPLPENLPNESALPVNSKLIVKASKNESVASEADVANQKAPSDEVFNIDDFFSDSSESESESYSTESNDIEVENQHSSDTEYSDSSLRPEHATAGNSSQDTLALRAFLQELDMQPSQLLGQNKVEVLKVAGILLRTLTEGMMGVLKARTLMKEKLELDQTQISDDRNNAFKFSQSPQVALAKMLTQEHGYMDPISAANEAVDDAKAHQLAMISGLNVAIQRTIEAFDPKNLEQEFEGGFSLNKKAKYWDHYCEIYERVAENAQVDSSNIFLKHFREHYELQLLKLVK